MIQAPIEHEEETEKGLENEMSFHIGRYRTRDNKYILGHMNEARSELYPGCLEISSLNLFVKLMHVKVFNSWSNKCFDILLELLKHAFSMYDTIIPSLFYEAKRKLRDLDLGYETIHACKYDSVLSRRSLAICNIV